MTPDRRRSNVDQLRDDIDRGRTGDKVRVGDPAAAPLEQTLYVTARAEVNSGEPTERASTPIILRIVPASGTPTAAGSNMPQPDFD